MFLNPWYGGEAPPTANGGVLNNSQQQQHSPLSSLSHSPQSSPTPHHRITLSSLSSNSPAHSPTLLPRNSHLHTHFGYLSSPSPALQNSTSSSNTTTNTSSSSNNSSPVLMRNNNSSSNSSPRLSRNLNTFHTPHSLLSIGGKGGSLSDSPPLSKASIHSTSSSHASSTSIVTVQCFNNRSNTLPQPQSDRNNSFSAASFSNDSSGTKTLPIRTPPGTPSLHVLQTLLDNLQMKLRPGWTVHCTTDGRYFYCK